MSWVSPSPDICFERGEVERAIQSFPPGSGGGPSGLRPIHVKEMLCSSGKDRILLALAGFAACLCSGGFGHGSWYEGPWYDTHLPDLFGSTHLPLRVGHKPRCIQSK